VIDNPVSYEIHAVACFFHAKNKSAVEIQRELRAVCSQSVISEGAVRQRCRMLKDG
jgi:hypothetical protein